MCILFVQCARSGQSLCRVLHLLRLAGMAQTDEIEYEAEPRVFSFLAPRRADVLQDLEVTAFLAFI